MKKIIATLLCITTVLSLAACRTRSSQPKTSIVYGEDKFFSFEDLYAILDKYTIGTDLSSLLYA